MKFSMKRRYVCLLFLLTLLYSCSSGRQRAIAAARELETMPLADGTGAVSAAETVPGGSETVSGSGASESAEFQLLLERIAEIERTGSFFPGLGLIESGGREEAGDYTGAVFAVYKDLCYAYGYNRIPKAEVEEGIRNLLTMKDDTGNAALQTNVLAASRAVQAFFTESWQDAASLLLDRKPFQDEPDSFYQWMLLVSDLESRKPDPAIRAAYGAIRGRYGKFPEYWYRGARAFEEELAVVYAEQCINLNPESPFALECRNIIGASIGLDSGGNALRSHAEIEYYIRKSVSEENPEILLALFPLFDLPDNDYTLFALSEFKSLARLPVFRDYFEKQAVLSSGRLAERLSFLTRG